MHRSKTSVSPKHTRVAERAGPSPEEITKAKVADQLEISEDDAQRLIKESVRCASPNNLDPSTGVELVFPDNEEQRRRLTRRHFIARIAAAVGGLSGVVAANVVANIATDVSRRVLTDSTTGLDFWDRVLGHEIPEQVMKLIYERRPHNRGHLLETLGNDPQVGPPAKFLLRCIDHFDRGNLLPKGDVDGLERFLNKSKTIPTQILVTDVLTADLIRSGQGVQALPRLEKMLGLLTRYDRYDRQKVVFAHRWGDAHYTVLRSEHWLNSRAWNFERALKALNGTVAAVLDMKISEQADGTFVLDHPPKLSDTDRLDSLIKLYGVPGFYLITFAFLYLVVRARLDERRELANLQYQFCRAFHHNRNLNRAVWNSSFEACLQLHRLESVSNLFVNERAFAAGA